MLELAGAPAEVIQSVEAKASPNPDEVVCYVWEENWQSLQFFLIVQTQWILVSGLAGAVRVGLDFSRVESAMRMNAIPRREWKALFADLRIMEAAVLEYDSRKKD